VAGDSLLVLNRQDVLDLLPLNDCIEAVELAFRAHALGELPAAPGVLGTHLQDGGLHVKTAALGTDPCYVAAKANANFPNNPARFGLPTIQGLLLLFDGRRGTPLAVMDAREITALRTAAASAVAARYLARADSQRIAFIGCGIQARRHLEALALVRPIIRAFAFDTNPEAVAGFTDSARNQGIEVTATASVAEAVAAADICITSTPSRRAIVTAPMLHPGLFLAAVGADNPDKHELDPLVFRAASIVVDLLDQAATMGDLHHALDAGVVTRTDVGAELGQVVAGQRPGRGSPDEIIVFDSTGTALQDVAAAVVVYQRALHDGRGTRLSWQ
jgi:alanine dehydrogenase